MDRSDQIYTFSRFTKVSRETTASLIKYENIIIERNLSLNLIGKSTINQIWIRHFLDSAQAIDFIDKNDKIITDIGSGAGFPGIILAFMAKDRKIPIKIELIEKSKKKTEFLKRVVSELNLNVDVINENIFENKVKNLDGVFIARAFKPLKVILELMHNMRQNNKKIIIFLGKSGKKELLEASKTWDIEYKQRVSVTSSDSLVIEINKLEKKN